MTQTPDHKSQPVDIFVIGGGVNGCGIARDMAGRGLSVTLAEMNDLASATSSASTKMFHGGLRYLEFFEIGLVAKALKEREVLLRAMPHISWPLRFVLPFHKDMRFESDTPTSKLLRIIMPWAKGQRPAWLIRLGLFLYDNLGKRQILSGTSTVNLRSDPAGAPLKDKYTKAFEYSDCWIDDSRLVVLNARDASLRGANIMTQTKVIDAKRVDDLWHITTQNQITGAKTTYQARALINASGPWVSVLKSETLGVDTPNKVRLVRGSHIVTRKLFDHDKGYFFQGSDGRVIFAIPYETDFTLIGTTDAEHENPSTKPECTEAEAEYLRAFASEFFAKPITDDDIVWRYSGVRPLFDDGANSATSATRDYVLGLNADGTDAPLINVFGGKITTYRKLSQEVFAKLQPYFPQATQNWTAGIALPGGDFPVDGVSKLITQLQQDYPFLDATWAQRLVRTYGTDARNILKDAKTATDLGQNIGATLTESEVRWLVENEFARTSDDIIWRRSKLGLRLSKSQISDLDVMMKRIAT